MLVEIMLEKECMVGNTTLAMDFGKEYCKQGIGSNGEKSEVVGLE